MSPLDVLAPRWRALVARSRGPLVLSYNEEIVVEWDHDRRPSLSFDEAPPHAAYWHDLGDGDDFVERYVQVDSDADFAWVSERLGVLGLRERADLL